MILKLPTLAKTEFFFDCFAHTLKFSRVQYCIKVAYSFPFWVVHFEVLDHCGEELSFFRVGPQFDVVRREAEGRVLVLHD